MEGKRETKKRSRVEGKKGSRVKGSRVRGKTDRFEGVYHTDTVKGVDNQHGEWGDGSQSSRRGEERKQKTNTGDGMGSTKIWIQGTRGNGRKGKRVTRSTSRVKGYLRVKSLG